MKTNRMWIETAALGTAMACALGLLIAVLAAGTVAVAGRGGSEQATEPESATEPGSLRQHTYEGMLTCSRCGAKHSAKLGRSASNCTLTCVHEGAKFALVDGDKLYQLDGDVKALKRLAGQRARVVGVMHGNEIIVSSIADEN